MWEYSNNEQWWMNDSVWRETKKYDIFLWETKYVRAKLVSWETQMKMALRCLHEQCGCKIWHDSNVLWEARSGTHM